ncbi:cytochrome c-type biogenesis protein CcmH [Sphingobium sp. B2]|uniref:cytochrome c-type biogenesis protein CcmH n=1 Tax=Sphingobium sp. B2 TaxID=2583228 RepID=UPI00119F4926|nr:cytochrome c-type biogenesis protein CcmH [Sphingobium sp. B2]
MRILAALLALILPPLGLLLWRGSDRATLLLSILWLAGMAVCWLLWAGPGLLLCALASVLAAVIILFRPRRSRVVSSTH